MDKLSNVLPSRNRVTDVDVTESQPARPGAPSNGRPMGITPMQRHTSALDIVDQNKINDKNIENVKKASDDFFKNQKDLNQSLKKESSFLEGTQNEDSLQLSRAILSSPDNGNGLKAHENESANRL